MNIVGITHREIQTCPECKQLFQWSPAVGLCPYCDLSPEARQGPIVPGNPCPSNCCPMEKEEDGK